MILVAFFFLTQSAFGQQTQEDTAARAGVVWRQGPRKVVVLCFGVPGTELLLLLCLQMVKQQKLSGGTLSELRRWANPHRKCQSKVWCFLQVIFHKRKLANMTFTGYVWRKRKLQAITGPLIGVQ